MVRIVHLNHAFQIQPDKPSRDRLLDAVDARNASIATYFDARGRPSRSPAAGRTRLFLRRGTTWSLRLEENGYQEPYANTAFNWDTKAMRAAPLPGREETGGDRRPPQGDARLNRVGQGGRCNPLRRTGWDCHTDDHLQGDYRCDPRSRPHRVRRTSQRHGEFARPGAGP